MTNDPLGLFDEDSTSDPLGLFEETDKKFLSHKEKQKAIEDGVAGIVDTGMGMVAGLPSQLAGGIWGLSTLLSGQGLEKAAGPRLLGKYCKSPLIWQVRVVNISAGIWARLTPGLLRKH
jgi:hypothetical protein